MIELSGRTVGIWGLGKEGLSMARTASAHGAERIIAVDDRAIDGSAPDIERLTVHYGPDAPNTLRDTDIVFVSPGVPWQHPIFEDMRRNGPPVSSAADWYMTRHGAQTIGVTGTKGKSTTASFLAHLLAGLGVPAVAAGNIGTPLSDLSPASGQWVVAELSSQQCALLSTSPAVAVITNLYQDHLDWHGDIASYYSAKAAVFAGGARVLITTAGVTSALRGVGIEQFPPVHELSTTGVYRPAGDSVLAYPHNAINAALAAAAAAEVLGRPVTEAEIDSAAANFTRLPHRLQTVRTAAGRRWIDDTLATTGESVVAALSAMPADDRIALIVGGMDRSLDYRQVDEFLCAGTRDVTLIQAPTNGALIGAGYAGAHPDRVHRVEGLEEAVRLAAGLPGVDIVLLSPGAASYDLYRNYEAKGAAFCAVIDSL
ncbi:UDP-N-acetylmuramoyl-L-alanine--D-glutamate ligase [Mycolicibacterium neoaurum]|uniref:UDP-N-acetylmuramoyl-L-alanine--D-glutamate ligase n=1 Tax=Mycolicibacterium neoaurum TaxID=1795 RepID=UPI00248CDC02|nr:UDP-N-acetylmuramoyl-L-alanine--D-glutamate ligase [Mycolicibacterium neoaurum]WBP95391.1 UDP-N-acetylmuramoyl-L-alanine--D-glutamate ligase [Mycolicibacterium neoaurum]WBS09073.1 UDP-N-acetylmuramoyl-L-alanine--D-glutamate ligase [Mycolicibacterium neoaurum]